MPSVGTASVDLEVDRHQLGRSLSGAVGSQGKAIDGEFSKIGKSGAASMGNSFKGAFAGVGAALVAQGAFRFIGGAMEEAGEAARVTGQLTAGIESTGNAANVSVGQIDKMATSISKLSGFEDDSVKQGSALLLTFTNIKNGVGEGNQVFDQATGALADVAARMGTDVPSAAIQLGKALNDPIQGIGSLRRIGVQFTEEQEAQIKTLVESGDVMGAQKVILKELQVQFGGSAKALGDARTPAENFSLAMGELKESIGTALIPVITKLTDFLVPLLEKFETLPGPVKVGIVIFGGLVAALVVLAPVIAAVSMALPILGGALALLFSPIGLLVAAVVGLGIVVWKNWDTIKEAFSIGVEFVGGLLDSFVGFIASIPGKVGHFVNEVIGFIGSIPGRLIGFVGELVKAGAEFGKAILRGIVNGITGAVEFVADIGKAVVNALINLVNDKVIGSINSALEISWDPPGPIGKISLNPPDIPKIPNFHEGGLVPGRPGEEVFALLKAGETVLPAGSQSGTANQVFHIAINNPEPEPASTSLPRAMRRSALELAAR